MNERIAPRPKLLVAGNWKMNGLRAALREVEAVKAGINALFSVDVVIFPPATLLHAVARIAEGTPLKVGGQDCHWENAGAYTGDISAAMLTDAGASAVLLGHSERREGHSETSGLVRKKAAAAHKVGLETIICVGETLGERAAGLATSVCTRQLCDSLPDEASPDNTVIAYEPVWAIGSGAAPASHDIAAMHALLREQLDSRFPFFKGRRWRILYGGSISPVNAEAILNNREVDGVLVGGASLNAVSFLAIIAAGEKVSMAHAMSSGDAL